MIRPDANTCRTCATPEENQRGIIDAQTHHRPGRVETIMEGAQLRESDRRENGANITEDDGATVVSTGKVLLKFGLGDTRKL
jgi:hypothetical protein